MLRLSDSILFTLALLPPPSGGQRLAHRHANHERNSAAWLEFYKDKIVTSQKLPLAEVKGSV